MLSDRLLFFFKQKTEYERRISDEISDVCPPDLLQPQPIAFARGHAPPLWLATGDGDTRVRPRNSQNLAAAIERLGGSAALRIYPNMGHQGIVMALAHPFRGKGERQSVA